MDNQVHNYSAFEQQAPQIGNNLMGALTDLADQLEKSDEEVIRLQALLDEAKANSRRICEKEIPDLLDGMQGNVKLPDGRTISVSEKIRSGAVAEKKIPAINWLDAHGHGYIVKKQFIIEFGRADTQWIKEFEKMLTESKVPLNVKKENSIHHSTLEAFIRQSLEDGLDIPKDIFAIYRQRIAKVKEK